MTDTQPVPAAELAAVQRRTVLVLSIGQVLGGVGFGATLSLGALLAAKISGNDALSGLAAAAFSAGITLFALPLAALAGARGRRPALALGQLVALVGVGLVIFAVAVEVFPLLLAGFALIGAAQAANLQSRFAATDLANESSRGRDLSIVVWTTTVGAVLGPNLIAPGEALGRLLGMPLLTGAFLFTIVGQALGTIVYLAWLRPDPLLLARQSLAKPDATRPPVGPDRPVVARFATAAVVGGHLVMVSIMSMTPIHLLHHGATLSVIGLTLSLHIAGMFGLSPVAGMLGDRWGFVQTIRLGCGLLTAAVALIVLVQQEVAVTVALVLLGLGWSALTVAGSALLTAASAPQVRTRRQGRTDFAMSLVGTLGAIAAGGVLSWVGFSGLALVTLPVIIGVALLSPFGSR